MKIFLASLVILAFYAMCPVNGMKYGLCLGSKFNSTAMWTQSLSDAWKTGDLIRVVHHYDKRSVVSAFGKTFRGKELKQLLVGLTKSVRMEPSSFSILAVQEGTGSAVVECTGSGIFTQSKNRFSDLTTQWVFHWNLATGKIKKQELFPVDQEKLVDAALPRAERLGLRLLEAWFESPLLTTNSSLFGLIDPDFTLKINVYPSSILSRTLFVGSDDLLTLMQELYRIHAARGSSPRSMYKKMKNVRVKVIYADDSTLISKLRIKKDLSILLTHRFNDEGLLQREEMTFSRPFMPWEYKPIPRIAF